MDGNTWILSISTVAAALIGWQTWRRGWLSRSALGSRQLAGIDALVWLFGMLLLMLAPMVGSGAVAGLPVDVIGVKESLRWKAMVQGGGGVLGLVVGVAFVVLIRRGCMDVEGRRTGLRLSWSDGWRGIIGLLLILPLYIVVSSVARWLDELFSASGSDVIQHQTLKALQSVLRGSDGAAGDRAWVWLWVATLVVAVPAIEELIYRGCLQSLLLRLLQRSTPDGELSTRGSPPLIAITLTSVLFALMHVATGAVPSWSAAIALFILSLGLGIAFERSGRLSLPIVMHGLFNAANIAAVAAGWA